jgi:hypothetical protein
VSDRERLAESLANCKSHVAQAESEWQAGRESSALKWAFEAQRSICAVQVVLLEAVIDDLQARLDKAPP